MGRRRHNSLGDLVALAALLPWWLALALAAASFLLLDAIAANRVSLPAVGNPMSSTLFHSVVVAMAKVGRFILPGAFVFGAVTSLYRTARASKLVSDFGRARGRIEKNEALHTWREFEVLVGEVYRRQGYHAAPTREGADGGVDLVLRRGDETLLVQCKHWQARTVGVNVVRELRGVIAAAGAAGGAVVTSGEFTREAVEFAKTARVDLINGKRLRALARQLAPAGSPAIRTEPTLSSSARAASALPNCPQCGSLMVLRTAKRGTRAGERFWGCGHYPKCKGIRPSEA
jgi:restriction system protein